MISLIRTVLALAVLMLLASCSSDSIKRNTYQSLQIMKQRECQQQPGSQDCPQPQSYNKYEKQREEELEK